MMLVPMSGSLGGPRTNKYKSLAPRHCAALGGREPQELPDKDDSRGGKRILSSRFIHQSLPLVYFCLSISKASSKWLNDAISWWVWFTQEARQQHIKKWINCWRMSWNLQPLGFYGTFAAAATCPQKIWEYRVGQTWSGSATSSNRFKFLNEFQSVSCFKSVVRYIRRPRK